MADANDLELAYFAGFFDGEGCVGSYHRKHSVCLTNTDARSLSRARELWGGSILKQSKESRRGARQDIFQWYIYGHYSRKFLEDIRPFVKMKGDQIDCYLTILDVIPHKRGTRRQPGTAAIIDMAQQQLSAMKRGGTRGGF